MNDELKGYFKSENVNEIYMRAQLLEEYKKRKHTPKEPTRKPKPDDGAKRTGCVPELE